jgi:ribosomal protein S14
MLKKLSRDYKIRTSLHQTRFQQLLTKTLTHRFKIERHRSENISRKQIFASKQRNLGFIYMTRVKSYCIITGTARSVLSKSYGITRMNIKYNCEQRVIPGVKHISW